MNTTQENTTVNPGQGPARAKRRDRQLRWAKAWHKGNAYCPICRGEDIKLVNLDTQANTRIETFACARPGCSGTWKVESRESALAIIEEKDREPEWIELAQFDLKAPATQPDPTTTNTI